MTRLLEKLHSILRHPVMDFTGVSIVSLRERGAPTKLLHVKAEDRLHVSLLKA